MGIDRRTELRQFLRSRRARVRPEDVGLPRHGRRRVPGLRREELAQLAGVSVGYYTRLEQGYSHNVSPRILDALAAALRLSDAEREHLTRLVGPVPSPRLRARGGGRPVRPGLRLLLERFDQVPAYVLGPALDVLAWNGLARALLADFPSLPPAERNTAWLAFLDADHRSLYEDWPAKAAYVVAALRQETARYPCDARLCELVDELRSRSAEFRELWERHDIREQYHGAMTLQHPVAGRLTLRYETLTLPDDPGQSLVMMHADPGSPSEDGLRLLASWSAERTAGAGASAGSGARAAGTGAGCGHPHA